jgi:nickel-type superoxide dismutase maturation protease
MLPFAVYRVTGQSMAPGIGESDYVLVNRLSYVLGKPRYGDVVVAKHPGTGRLIVKRVAKVESNRYLLRGDNEKASSDSRGFGAVTRKMLVGKVWKVFRGG